MLFRSILLEDLKKIEGQLGRMEPNTLTCLKLDLTNLVLPQNQSDASEQKITISKFLRNQSRLKNLSLKIEASVKKGNYSAG